MRSLDTRSLCDNCGKPATVELETGVFLCALCEFEASEFPITESRGGQTCEGVTVAAPKIAPGPGVASVTANFETEVAALEASWARLGISLEPARSLSPRAPLTAAVTASRGIAALSSIKDSAIAEFEAAVCGLWPRARNSRTFATVAMSDSAPTEVSNSSPVTA
jgi:hypothetical protein